MKSWFVINTKPKKEFQVKMIFQEAGFNYYNPVYESEGKVKPFFPGYGFLFFDFPGQYQLVRFTRGVKRVVGNREGPIPIPEDMIQEIKRREVNGLIELAKYGEEPEVGDEVEIAEGPWKGLRGIFKKELSDRNRVMILLSYVSFQGQLLIEKKKLKKVAK
ncbi:MAG: transcription termination/antitermination NusG family protein [Clostridiales bacterium]|nr:transcription termination/antitermination NusG family protein [Clostridiales bacterium]